MTSSDAVVSPDVFAVLFGTGLLLLGIGVELAAAADINRTSFPVSSCGLGLSLTSGRLLLRSEATSFMSGFSWLRSLPRLSDPSPNGTCSASDPVSRTLRDDRSGEGAG